MYFSMSEIDKLKEAHLDETISLPQLSSECGQVETISGVRVVLDVFSQEGIYPVTGDITTDITYVCSRCLGVFRHPLNAKFHESFSRIGQKAELGAHLVHNDRVDLNPYIEQELFLAVEYHPVCKPDCLGLCSECGCNRNETVCSCDTQSIDPRLSVLKDLLFEGKSE